MSVYAEITGLERGIEDTRGVMQTNKSSQEKAFWHKSSILRDWVVWKMNLAPFHLKSCFVLKCIGF